MQATHDTVVLTPPAPPGMLRAVVLALVAHALLLAALTWGVHWKQTESAAVEAEIWSSVTQQAAPRAVEPPTPVPVPVPPQPVPKPEPQPAPQPVQKVTPPPPAPVVRDADIALEREKKKRELEKQRLEDQQEEKREQAKKLAAEKKKQEQKEKELDAKREAQAEEAKRKLADAADAKKKADAAKAKEQAALQQKQADALRQENLKRMAGLAGASGAAGATGTALQSTGPSSGYGGRVKAKVVPNIVFQDDVPGNPSVDVEVRCSPDGTIVSHKTVKPSAAKAWDDAVHKALDKTETMPRDADGRMPCASGPLIIGFSPKG
jgi:colicin import membrane protein